PPPRRPRRLPQHRPHPPRRRRRPHPDGHPLTVDLSHHRQRHRLQPPNTPLHPPQHINQLITRHSHPFRRHQLVDSLLHHIHPHHPLPPIPTPPTIPPTKPTFITRSSENKTAPTPAATIPHNRGKETRPRCEGWGGEARSTQGRPPGLPARRPAWRRRRLIDKRRHTQTLHAAP